MTVQAAAPAVEKPMFNVDDTDILVMRDKETRSKMNMILNTKTTSDVIFLKYIASDLLVNLNIVFNEVFQYIKVLSDVANNYSKASEKNKYTIRQMIYTAGDQVDMLYNIYYTIPSNIVSTDSIMISDSAPPNAINNPYVLAEAAKQISAILAALPSPASKINTYLTTVMKSVSGLAAESSPTDIEMFSLNLAQYLNTVDVQLKNLSKTVDDLTKAAVNNPVENSKIESATKAKSTFLNTTVSSLQSIVAALVKTNMTDPKVADSITDVSSRITSMQAALTAMKPQAALEGFASKMNPYDQPSANAIQSREFTLGRRAYSDEVFSGIKFW
jgi:methyl-accepting chemotaxis protein